jgi:hypothetical protein
MSVPIIVDEWIFKDLSGEEGEEKQVQAITFLYKLEEICDRIVVLSGSPFEKKMNQFLAAENDSVRFKSAKRVFLDLIHLNSLKKYILDESDVTELPAFLPPLIDTGDDHYLFKAYEKLKNKGCFILTCDNRWKHNELRKKGFRIKLKDSYLPEYLKRVKSA